MHTDRGRLSGVLRHSWDPAGPALAAVAAVLYALHGSGGYLSRDLALYAYANQQAADGVPPYLAVINRSGPLSHVFAVPGVLAARLVGGDELVGMRIWCLVLAAACVWVTYLLGRDVFGSRAAGLASAGALLTVDGFTQYAADGPREKTAMVLLLLVGLWAVTRRRPFLAGAFVSLATLTWQPALFAGAAAVGVICLTPHFGGLRARVRAGAAATIGALVPLAVFVAWYAAMGRLRDFLDCFVLIHVRYTEQPAAADMDWYQVLRDAYGVSLWVLATGGAVLVLRAIWGLTGAGSRTRTVPWVEIGLAAGLAAGVWWSVRVFNGWPDIFFLLPMATVGIGGLLPPVLARAPRLVTGVTGGWLLVAASLALVFSLGPHDDRLAEQRASVDRVMSALPPDATIVSIEAPQALVLTGKRDPVRHQMFGLGLGTYVDDIWPGGRDGLREDIARRRPTVITLGKYRRPWMMPLLERDYVEVESPPGWTWFVSRSVRQDVLTALVSRSAHDHG